MRIIRPRGKKYHPPDRRAGECRKSHKKVSQAVVFFEKRVTYGKSAGHKKESGTASNPQQMDWPD